VSIFEKLTLRRLQEHIDEVLKAATAAEPHHGLVWQAVAKDDANRGKSVAEILELVADKLK
jgi:pre-mRNA-processing factor 6